MGTGMGTGINQVLILIKSKRPQGTKGNQCSSCFLDLPFHAKLLLSTISCYQMKNNLYVIMNYLLACLLFSAQVSVYQNLPDATLSMKPP